LDRVYLHDATELSAIDGKPLAITAAGHALGGAFAQIQSRRITLA